MPSIGVVGPSVPAVEYTPLCRGVRVVRPQYVYLGLGFAIIECGVILTLRQRFPTISNVKAFGIAGALTFLVDICIEYLFILAEIYAYPRTIQAFTLSQAASTSSRSTKACSSPPTPWASPCCACRLTTTRTVFAS